MHAVHARQHARVGRRLNHNIHRRKRIKIRRATQIPVEKRTPSAEWLTDSSRSRPRQVIKADELVFAALKPRADDGRADEAADAGDENFHDASLRLPRLHDLARSSARGPMVISQRG